MIPNHYMKKFVFHQTSSSKMVSWGTGYQDALMPKNVAQSHKITGSHQITRQLVVDGFLSQPVVIFLQGFWTASARMATRFNGCSAGMKIWMSCCIRWQRIDQRYRKPHITPIIHMYGSLFQLYRYLYIHTKTGKREVAMFVHLGVQEPRRH